MCGIAGVATTAAGAARRAEELILGLRHRGPGEQGVADLGRIALASTRLSVVGLEARGGPRVSADGRVTAVVNGEIWNHAELRRELSAAGEVVPEGSDTEVVAPLFARYGVAGLARLRGMFALVLHDAATDTLVAARDRFGIKPLYLRTTSDGVEFASEAGVWPRSVLDRPALADYLTLGFLPAPATLDPAVRKVPAGVALVRRGGGPWREEPLVAAHAVVDDRPLAAVLESAVERHLMADVPVGVFLSGGLDSAAVAALVRRLGAPLRTFSLVFPDELGFDEGPEARRTAEWLGAEHREVAMEPRDLPALLPLLARSFGEPFADSSALAVAALARRAADEVTVVLTGTGADELFAGYRRHAVGDVPAGVRRLAGLAARCLPQHRYSTVGRLGLYAAKLGRAALSDPAAAYLTTLEVLTPERRAALLGEVAEPAVLARVRDAFRGAPSFADGARAADLALYLPDDLLAKEDRATMAFSLESRVPFLDDAVADAALAVAARDHGASLSGRRGKRRLRAALAGVLPPEILRRRKRGFAVPVSRWLRGPCRAYVDERLTASTALVRSLLRPDAVDALVLDHRRGDDRLAPGLYTLLALEESLRASEAASE